MGDGEGKMMMREDGNEEEEEEAAEDRMNVKKSEDVVWEMGKGRWKGRGRGGSDDCGDG